MLGKSIQLSFGVVRDLAIKDVARDGVIDNIALQKYLLATGLLKDSIQNSLDMIVTNGKFNNARIRRALDTKYPTIMRKPNPIDVVFKDKAKFDTQNPVIGKLLSQIQTDKNDKALQKQLEKAPSIKDLKIAEKLEHLKQFNNDNNNNDDDDNDDAPFIPPPQLLSSPFPPPAYPSSIDSDEGNIEDENPVQKFLLGGP